MRTRAATPLLSALLIAAFAAQSNPVAALPQGTEPLLRPHPESVDIVDVPPLWYSGDVHELVQLCGTGGTFPPDRTPAGLYHEMLEKNLNVSNALVYVAGSTTCQGYLDNYAPLVTGYEHPMTAADPDYFLYYGVEVMGNHEPSCLYPAWGHVAGMGLSSGWYQMNADYPTPNLDHFRFQPGGMAGYAHVSWPEGTRIPEDFPPIVRTLTRIYPLTAPADISLGKAQFISTPDVGHLATSISPDPWYGLYYKLLNAGMRPSPSGGTVAECYLQLHDRDARTYVMLDSDPLDYWKWLDGLKAGRVTIADGHEDFLQLEVNGAGLGEELGLSGTQTVTVEAQLHVAVPRNTTLEIIQDGVVVASDVVQMTGPGVHTFQTSLNVSESGWIAARTLKTHTGAIYTIVDRQPITDTAAAQYFSAFNDQLLAFLDLAGVLCAACGGTPCPQCDELTRWVGQSEASIRHNFEKSTKIYDAIAAYEQPLPPGAVRYGFSSGSCKGPIGIGLVGTPTSGNTLRLTCFNAPPGSLGAVAMGLGGLTTPIPYEGSEILIDPFAASGYPLMRYVASNSGGYSETTFTVPLNMPQPLHTYVQFFWFNTGDCPGAGILSSSAALDVLVQ